MELRLLRYFTAVVGEGSISRAAVRLGVAQPAISRAMRALEESIGVPLLVRTSRSATPTEAGQLVAAEAQHILEQVDTLAVRAAAVNRLGRRIVCGAATGDAPLAIRLTASFETSDHGTTTLSAEPVIVNPGDVLRQVHAGRCDVALVRGPYEADSLDSELIYSEARVVMLAASHPLAINERLHMSQLHDEPITIWPNMSNIEREHWAGADLDGHAWRAGPVNRSATDVMVAVQMGIAIAFIPESIAPGGRLPQGLCVRPVDGLSPSELRLVWREDTRSLLVARFVRHAVTAGAAPRLS